MSGCGAESIMPERVLHFADQAVGPDSTHRLIVWRHGSHGWGYGFSNEDAARRGAEAYMRDPGVFAVMVEEVKR